MIQLRSLELTDSMPHTQTYTEIHALDPPCRVGPCHIRMQAQGRMIWTALVYTIPGRRKNWWLSQAFLMWFCSFTRIYFLNIRRIRQPEIVAILYLQHTFSQHPSAKSILRFLLGTHIRACSNYARASFYLLLCALSRPAAHTPF